MTIELFLLTLAVFILKLADCTLGTLKTIYLYKDKYISAATMNAASSVLYLIAVVQIAKSPDSTYGIIAVALATFLGTWAPAVWMKTREPDKPYRYEIISDTMENGKAYADFLMSMDIDIETSKAYRKRKKTMRILIHSPSKNTSRLIQQTLPPNFSGLAFCPVINEVGGRSN